MKKTKKTIPFPPPKAAVTVDFEFKDADRKTNFEAIAKAIVAIYETLFAPEPYLGGRPFVLLPSTDGMPRANVGEKTYNVIVTCLDEPWPTRLAYQIGHELGHFWIGPDSSSMLKECVCTAMSFVGLDELAKQWKDCPASPTFAEWADNMRDYHDRRTIAQALEALALKDMKEVASWAKTKGPELIRNEFHRTEEQLMARMIETVLRRHPRQWAALQQLGKIPDTTTDAGTFEKWRSLVAEEQKPLIEKLAATFGLPIREKK